MGHGAMAVLSLQEAAERTETSKADIWCAIQAGRLLAQRSDDGGFAIDPADLFRVFRPQRPDECPMEQDATTSPEASERPETSATPETAATNDMTVALGALRAELKGLLDLPAEAPANDELRQNRERDAQVVELVAERAKAAEKATAKFAALEERAKPWWMRLVGWIHTRRFRAARKRLRERL
jgi:hypothetical protein